RMGPGLATANEGPSCLACSALRRRGRRGGAGLGGAVDRSRGRGSWSESVQISSVIESAVRARGAALMGVVNTTPDSFYDGGRYADEQVARARVDELLLINTAIVDIGAESSRPGATPVPAAEQITRMGPTLDYAVSRGALVSVDTTDPEVAEYAL